MKPHHGRGRPAPGPPAVPASNYPRPPDLRQHPPPVPPEPARAAGVGNPSNLTPPSHTPARQSQLHRHFDVTPSHASGVHLGVTSVVHWGSSPLADDSPRGGLAPAAGGPLARGAFDQPPTGRIRQWSGAGPGAAPVRHHGHSAVPRTPRRAATAPRVDWADSPASVGSNGKRTGETDSPSHRSAKRAKSEAAAIAAGRNTLDPSLLTELQREVAAAAAAVKQPSVRRPVADWPQQQHHQHPNLARSTSNGSNSSGSGIRRPHIQLELEDPIDLAPPRPPPPLPLPRSTSATVVIDGLAFDLDGFDDDDDDEEEEEEEDDDDDFWSHVASTAIQPAAAAATTNTVPRGPARAAGEHSNPAYHPTPSSSSSASTNDSAAFRALPSDPLPCWRFRVLFAEPPSPGSRELRVHALPEHVHAPAATRAALPTPVVLSLRDEWAATRVEPGDVLHIVATPEGETAPPAGEAERLLDHARDRDQGDPPRTVDAYTHLVVVHPDVLLSGSMASEANGCVRRAVLKERYRFAGTSVAAMLGTLGHDCVQRVLGNLDLDFDAAAAAAIRKHAVGLAAIGYSTPQALEYLRDMYEKVWSGFLRPLFAGYNPTPPAISGSAVETVRVDAVLDIEENAWSPTFGLKGKMDATLLTRVHAASHAARVQRYRPGTTAAQQQQQRNPRGGAAEPAGPDRRGNMTLEMKTGKTRDAHRTQVLMYHLLLLDAYRVPALTPVGGMLYNLKDNDVDVVMLHHGELRDLLIMRNALAAAIRRPHALPPVLGPAAAADACARCFQSAECMVLHRVLEHGSAATMGLDDWDARVGHITPAHAQFLRHWLHLLALEAEENDAKMARIWLDEPCTAAAESAGAAPAAVGAFRQGQFRGLTYVSTVPAAVANGAATRGAATAAAPRFLARFAVPKPVPSQHTSSQAHAAIDTLSVDPLPFAPGDVVVVSREGGPYALVQGLVDSVDRHGAVVSTDRPLRFDAAAVRGDRFRIDVFEAWGASTATMHHNLLSLFLPVHSRLRELIVDLVPPRVAANPPDPGLLPAAAAALNDRQRRVIAQCAVHDQDYTLVVGMPGTGKSHTLAHLLATLVRMGLRVLLSSHTHSAVDTVLLKAKELAVPFVRLGESSRIHPEIRSAMVTGHATPEAVQAAVDNARVVGVTCLGVTHPLLSPPPPTPQDGGGGALEGGGGGGGGGGNRTNASATAITARAAMFDVCIVDEASQIALPTILGPLSFARRFILVGDHHQLSPVVRSSAAAAGGLANSLFERLIEAHPRATVDLDVQYRMNKDIMALANATTYQNRLTCGSPAVANRALPLRRPLAGGLPPWIRAVLDGPAVAFVHVPRAVETTVSGPAPAVGTTGGAGRGGGGNGGGVINTEQVDMVRALVTALVVHGVRARDIGVITPYRAQLRRIAAALHHHHAPARAAAQLSGTALAAALVDASAAADLAPVECLTIDQYQGRDKDVIVVSLVRCNAHGQVGDLLMDWKRINVALTRARAKLVLIGCATTLRNSLLWTTFLDVIEQNGWMISV
ncbi:DNA replication endonuclease-helicase Dna2 [Blastocladiella emersonii ATCC 22665]|nr:DNA replication endonuclease-helicase Dna2 [Blastocladiella emersonii ATCC 22665]